MSPVDGQLQSALAISGYSMTKPRRVVFAMLQQADTLSMADLVRNCAPVIDRSSVYRTVELFEELGIVSRVQLGWKYELELSDQFRPHHHHAVCTNCGRIVDIREHAELDHELAVLARRHGFMPSSHLLEIRGLCPACQQLSPANRLA